MITDAAWRAMQAMVACAMMAALGAVHSAHAQTAPVAPVTPATPATPPTAAPQQSPFAAPGGPVPANDKDLALITAAEKGQLDQVAQAMRAGGRINALDPHGRTALLAAAYGNHVPV